MTYLQKKKLAFMSIVNQIKGFVRTVTGIPPLSLPDCVDEDSIINYTIDGNSIQGGTPTPENPVEVESVGEYDEETGKYKIPVKCSGKNLFDINNLKGNSYVTNNNDGTITVTRYSANSGAKLKQLCPDIKVGDSVVFSMKTAGNPLIYLSCGINWNNTSRKTITQEMLDSNVFFYTSVNDSNTPVIISNIQMERDTLSDYEPYREPTITNIYLDEPLRKVGDYVDSIDFKNQKLIQHVYHEKITTVLGRSSLKPFLSEILKCPIKTGAGINVWGVLSNKFEKAIDNTRYDKLFEQSGAIGTYITSGGLNRIAYTFKDSSINTVELAQSAIGDGFDVYYRLDTPLEIDIDLPKLPTFKGTTIYSVETQTQPSNMEVSYYSTAKE